MTEVVLPPNVYRVAQRRFDAIPSSPWVYWISEDIRGLFETLPSFTEVVQSAVGLQTSDNFRFLRYWWEIGRNQIAFSCFDHAAAVATGRRWFPHMKGGPYRKWYGNQEYVLNYCRDGYELKAWADPLYGHSGWSRIIKSVSYYYREGITWSHTSIKGLNIRYMPNGFICNVEGMAAYPVIENLRPIDLLGILNSQFVAYIMGMLNPSLHFGGREIQDLPFPSLFACTVAELETTVLRSIYLGISESFNTETTFDFTSPLNWATGLDDLTAGQAHLAALEAQIDEEVYRLYDISDEDRAAIEAELAGGISADEEAKEETEPEPPITIEELAVCWISYAIGVVLGRFQPGVPGALGSAIYRRDDFAVGSLPAPDEAEFDQLVGPVERFAYVDDDGGRHLFPAEVEAALRDLALPDGIAVLDKGHERDLPALVRQALTLMLGDGATQDVIGAGAGGDLRKFLERDYFTRWHLRWYRKRPVYWPLQSARRSYGFVLFHERVDQATLYVLQREYLDHKLNGLQLRIGDLRGQLEGKEGRARKQVEREIDKTAQLWDEIAEFARTMERIIRAGYEPTPGWIDDGVILRLAPLWELIPIWKREPKKYWERLERGDYDWSHIAMRYWPERVREACRVNKSFAIAHGHEEWYEED